jgi:hypothetical protein
MLLWLLRSLTFAHLQNTHKYPGVILVIGSFAHLHIYSFAHLQNTHKMLLWLLIFAYRHINSFAH